MKELLNITNKKEWMLTSLLKIAIYTCWYFLAIIFTSFLCDEVTDGKLVLMVICLIIIYTMRLYLKKLYKQNASNSYFNIKHAIEMYYFKKLNNMSYEEVEKINKEELSNKILQVSYNLTKIINDLGEYIIPSILGFIILFIRIIDISRFLGLIAIMAASIIFVFSYFKYEDNKEKVINNHNDLLKDFINKILTIKKTNTFNYFYKKLDDYKDNNTIILKSNDTLYENDLNLKIFIYNCVVIISAFFLVNNTITRLGLIIFFIIMTMRLQDLVIKINPAINNIAKFSANKVLLDQYFKENEKIEYEDKWKKIAIKDGVKKYSDEEAEIKIPFFELLKGDHVGIMGKSGQGKSTVLNILSGMFDLNKGEILFNGNVSNKRLNVFYNCPSTELFKISLRENLLLEKEIKDEVIMEYISELNLTEWLNSLPNGLDTILDNNIDIKIKVKLNLIRAIIQNKEVYFLDDPTYNLEIDDEKKVASFIKKHLKEKTFIIVSSKPSITNICKKHYFIKNHTLLEKETLL